MGRLPVKAAGRQAEVLFAQRPQLIVTSKRHVVAVGDLGATETASPMTSSERCRA
jgi:hypothetical protein